MSILCGVAVLESMSLEIRFYICTAVCDMPGAYCKLIARKNYDPVPQYAQIILFRFVPDINGDDGIA